MSKATISIEADQALFESATQYFKDQGLTLEQFLLSSMIWAIQDDDQEYLPPTLHEIPDDVFDKEFKPYREEFQKLDKSEIITFSKNGISV